MHSLEFVGQGQLLTSYHPAQQVHDGQVGPEHINQTLERLLSHHVAQHQHDCMDVHSSSYMYADSVHVHSVKLVHVLLALRLCWTGPLPVPVYTAVSLLRASNVLAGLRQKMLCLLCLLQKWHEPMNRQCMQRTRVLRSKLTDVQ